MTVQWESLNWPVNSSLFKVSTKVCLCNDIIIVVTSGVKNTTVLRFDENSWVLRQNISLEVSEECLSILQVSGVVYYVGREGSVFQLICTPASSGNTEFGFESTSSENDHYSWLKLTWQLDNAIHVLGLKHGIAAIINFNHSFYYNVYSMKKEFVLKFSTKIPTVVNSPFTWCLYCFDSSKLSPQLKKKIFGELSLAVKEVVVLSSPVGQVFILPSLVKQTIEDAETVYWDTSNQLKQVEVLNGNIFLCYYGGKIVQCGTENYFSYYLPTTVQAIKVIEYDNDILVLWSDDTQLRSILIKDNALKLLSIDKPLYGVKKIFTIGSVILACNSNFNFYKLAISTNISFTKLKSDDLLNEMKISGTEIELVKEKIVHCDSVLAAINAEQKSSGKLAIEENGAVINVINNSDCVFVKNLWSIVIEAIYDDKKVCSSIPLVNDLTVGSSVPIELPNNCKGCKSIFVFLVGNVSIQQRLLRVDVGSLNTGESLCFTTILSDKIKHLF